MINPNKYTVTAYKPVNDGNDYQVFEINLAVIVPNLAKYMELLGAETWEIKDNEPNQTPFLGEELPP